MLRLLLVEDNEFDAELIEYRIRAEGIKFHLTRVDSRAEFSTAIAREKWDLIITDFSLPSFNAMDVLRIVRAHDTLLPVILVTGTKPEGFGEDFIKKGATDYLMKCSLTRLGSSIRRGIETRKLQEALAKYRTRIKGLTGQLRSFHRDGNPTVGRPIDERLASKLNAIGRDVSFVAKVLRAKPAPAPGSVRLPASASHIHRKLSTREREVADLLGAGKSLKQIAAELSLSEKTVSTYRARILAKLNLVSTGEVVVYMAKNRLS